MLCSNQHVHSQMESPEVLALSNAFDTVGSPSTVGLVTEQRMPQVFCMDPAHAAITK